MPVLLTLLSEKDIRHLPFVLIAFFLFKAIKAKGQYLIS